MLKISINQTKRLPGKKITWQKVCENFSDPGDCLTPSSTLGKNTLLWSLTCYGGFPTNSNKCIMIRSEILSCNFHFLPHMVGAQIICRIWVGVEFFAAYIWLGVKYLDISSSPSLATISSTVPGPRHLETLWSVSEPTRMLTSQVIESQVIQYEQTTLKA